MQDDHDDTDTPAGTRSMRRWRRCMPGRSRDTTAPRYTLGGQDPLDGISVYWADAPVPHWHYITYGFSELYAWPPSECERPDRTGVAAAPLGLHCRPAVAARHGHLQFLQLVGLTDEEMEAVKRWSTRGVLQALQPAMPLWVSDLHRGNLLEDPALAERVRAGSERRGSSTGMLFVETLDWRQEAGVTTLVLGAGQVASVCELLPLRLRHGKSLELVGRERQWAFIPAGHARRGRTVGGQRALGAERGGPGPAVRAERGIYPLTEALRIDVVPTYLRDARAK